MRFVVFFVFFKFLPKLFEENVLSLEAWLKENKLMRYKDVFEEQVDDLNDLSCEILQDNERTDSFI